MDEAKPETKEEEAFRLLRGSNTVHRYESKSADLGLVDYFASGWRQLTRQMATATISKADASFDEEDFLDSATDAFVTVNELVGEGKLDALRPLLSDRLHAAISTVHKEYETNELSMSIDVEGIDSAVVEHARLLALEEGESQMRETEGDATEISIKLPDIIWMTGDSMGHPSRYDPNASAGWLVVGVRFKSTERSKIYNKDGMVVADTTDGRGHLWQFIRGPLPPTKQLPSADLQDIPWRVLNFGPPQGGGFVSI